MLSVPKVRLKNDNYCETAANFSAVLHVLVILQPGVPNYEILSQNIVCLENAVGRVS